MTDGIDRRERIDLLDWFEGLALNRGYVFAMRELYPKQHEKLISWGFTVTPVGAVKENSALTLCGVSAGCSKRQCSISYAGKLLPSGAND